MTWRPYPRDRLIEDAPEGFAVIVPVDAPEPVPLACPTCSYLMRTRDDEAAYLDFGCCDRCAMLWAQPRRQQWRAGWRPSPDQVAAAEADRLPLSIVLDVD